MNNYVLTNALTPEERKELGRKKDISAKINDAAKITDTPISKEKKSAARIRLQQKNPAILKSTGFSLLLHLLLKIQDFAFLIPKMNQSSRWSKGRRSGKHAQQLRP